MFLRRVLSAFSFVAALLILFYLAVLVKALYEHIRFKLPFPKDEFKPSSFLSSLSKNSVIQAVIVFVMIVGVVNFIASHRFSSHQIGAFYEEDNYYETYEATLYIGDKAVYCLADMHRETDRDEDRRMSYYWVDEIRFPYGHTAYVDEEYDPKEENSYCISGASAWNDYDCIIKLNHVATESSFELLQNTVVTSYGPCCASRDSDKFHWLSCPSVANISNSNLIFFESPEEADLLGFEVCDLCFNE